MRSLTVAIWLCVNAATAAQATPPCSACGIHAEPAPEMGTGIPALLVVGGVLLGATLYKRRRPA
jgi:hypothetical protein